MYTFCETSLYCYMALHLGWLLYWSRWCDRLQMDKWVLKTVTIKFFQEKNIRPSRSATLHRSFCKSSRNAFFVTAWVSLRICTALRGTPLSRVSLCQPNVTNPTAWKQTSCCWWISRTVIYTQTDGYTAKCLLPCTLYIGPFIRLGRKIKQPDETRRWRHSIWCQASRRRCLSTIKTDQNGQVNVNLSMYLIKRGTR